MSYRNIGMSETTARPRLSFADLAAWTRQISPESFKIAFTPIRVRRNFLRLVRSLARLSNTFKAVTGTAACQTSHQPEPCLSNQCSKGSEVSLSRVPDQRCGSRGVPDLIGGESGPGVLRKEIETCMPADHVWRMHMSRQARRHCCISAPMLGSILSLGSRYSSM
jgi:hypothetical protein